MPIPFVGISFGLLEHRKRMGPAWWLYFFLHTRANFYDPSGQVTFTTAEAAQALDVTRRTIQLWYRRLKDEGYVQPVGDDAQEIKTIRITKYKSAPIMARSAKPFVEDERPFTPPAKAPSSPSIIYRETTYKTLKGFFEAVVDIISQSRNPIAELRRFWEFTWGPQDTPDFGRLGAAAQRAGHGRSRPGCRVLAMQAVLAAVGRRVLGNPIDYVEQMSHGPTSAPPPAPKAALNGPTKEAHPDEWQHPNHGDWDRFIIPNEVRTHGRAPQQPAT